ncbi:MAG: class I SAM-dependent methyltransferase [Promethearchaeota archaeon]
MTKDHEWSDEKVKSFVASMEQKIDERYTPFAQQILQYSDQFHTNIVHLMIDIGCGPGFLGLELLRLAPGKRVIGVDPDKRMIRIAQRKAVEYGVSGFEARLGDAEQLPFDDGVGDIVVTLSAIHHWQHVPTGIREVYRVLKVGGLFIGKDRNRAHRKKQPDAEHDQGKHSNGLTLNEITTILQEAGFQIRLALDEAKYTIVAERK